MEYGKEYIHMSSTKIIYDNIMAAAGQGKMAKPWATQQPITEVREPATCTVGSTLRPTAAGGVTLQLTPRSTPAATHTSHETITESVAAFWKGLLNDVHAPSAQAERDKRGVLDGIRHNVKQLPEAVTDGLEQPTSYAKKISPRPSEACQARGSTPLTPPASTTWDSIFSWSTSTRSPRD